jgi:hypothetical protein
MAIIIYGFGETVAVNGGSRAPGDGLCLIGGIW